MVSVGTDSPRASASPSTTCRGTMLLVITGVGFLIHLYSTEYMAHDDRLRAVLRVPEPVRGDDADAGAGGQPGAARSWAGRASGICSYLLIGFWYTDAAKAWAGRKAFIANRIGDFGFILGAFLLVLLRVDVRRPGQGVELPRRGALERYAPRLDAAGPAQLRGAGGRARRCSGDRAGEA